MIILGPLDNLKLSLGNPSKKKQKVKINNKKNKNNKNNTENYELKNHSSRSVTGYLKNKKNSIKKPRLITINPILNKKNKMLKTEQLKLKESKKNIEQNKKESYNDDNDYNNYNELTFFKAKRIDKRNIFQLFKSILFEKLEIINLIISTKRVKIICICEYILSLLFDFFFNTLLYSDDVISKKYHNNGELDSIISI